MTQKPIFSSIHTHTNFCDGRDDVETMCRTAYEKGLAAIGFSAHAPVERLIGRETDWHLKHEKVNEYTAQVQAAKERWQGKLNVFLGYEVDYIRGKRSPLDSDITALNLDYIIGSVHYLFFNEGAQGFTVDDSAEVFEKGLKECYGGDAQKLMHDYYDAVIEMISGGGFEILGHADLIKKNCHDKNYWPQEIEERRQREVAAAAAKAGLIVEVNTGGINRKKINEVYPSLSFLRILREYDIPITITADAHCADDLDGNYDIALQTLILADFKEHLLFNGKTSKNILWQKENIIKI